MWRIAKFGAAAVTAVAGLYVGVAPVYYQYIHEQSGLVVTPHSGWLDAKLVPTSDMGLVARGTLHYELLFFNDGNRSTIVEGITWEVRSKLNLVGASHASNPHMCDMVLATTIPQFGRESSSKIFPLEVKASSHEKVSVNFGFEVPWSHIDDGIALIENCFTIEFTDFRGNEFRPSIDIFGFDIDEPGSVFGTTFARYPGSKRLLPEP